MQAAFTRTRQSLASIRDAAGLGRDVTDDEIVSAVTARLTAAAAPGDFIEEDPAIARQRLDLENREWSLFEREHGKDVADNLRRLRDLAWAGADVHTLGEAFIAAMNGSPPAPGTTPPPQGDAGDPGQADDGEPAGGEEAGGRYGLKGAPPVVELPASEHRSGRLREAAASILNGQASIRR